MERTYPLESLRRALFLLIAAIIAATGLALALVAAWLLGAFDPGSTGLVGLDLVFIGLPILVMGGLAGVIVWATLRVQLRVSERGIALVLPGARVEADWGDVETIRPAFLGPLTGDALVLRGPARVTRAWWIHLLDLGELSSAIPLAPFALPLGSSRLAADLGQHVPHVFDRPDAPAAESVDRPSG